MKHICWAIALMNPAKKKGNNLNMNITIIISTSLNSDTIAFYHRIMPHLCKEFLIAHFQNKAKLPASRVTWDMSAGRVVCRLRSLLGTKLCAKLG